MIRPIESRLNIFSIKGTGKIKQLLDIYKLKNSKLYKKKLIYGLVYLVLDLETGLIKVGKTTITLSQRKSQYVSNAKTRGVRVTPGSIEDRINTLLNSAPRGVGGNQHVYKTLKWIPIEILFRSGITKADQKLDLQRLGHKEQWYQNSLRSHDPAIGYDRTSGAAGKPPDLINFEAIYGKNAMDDFEGLIIPQNLIGYREILERVLAGCSLEQTYQSFPTASYNELVENIEYHWPFLVDRVSVPKSNHHSYRKALYLELRKYVLAPHVKNLFALGVDSSTDVGKHFSHASWNPKGIPSTTLYRLVKEMFNVRNWKTAIIKYGSLGTTAHTPLGHGFIHVSPQEFNDAGGQSMDTYWKHLLSTYLIKGATIEDIAQGTPLNYYQVKKLIHHYWKPNALTVHTDGTQTEEALEYARKTLVAPILAYCFSKDMKSAEIARYVPFFEGYNNNVNRWTTKWFRGITPKQARRLFVNGLVTSIDDFLNTYLL